MRAARLVAFVGGAPGVRYRRVTFPACALQLAAGCVAFGRGLVTRGAIPIALLAYALQLANRCVALGHSLVTRGAIPIALGCRRSPKLQGSVAFVGQTFVPGSVLGVLLEQGVALCARLITRFDQLGALG